jgi:hypothetical protein
MTLNKELIQGLIQGERSLFKVMKLGMLKLCLKHIRLW